jgi:hypothetical protein
VPPPELPVQPTRLHRLRAAREIVEGADAIPDGVLRDVRSGEQGLSSDDGVLHGGGLHLGAVPICVVHLHSLPLTEGIPCQGDESAARQSGEAALPGLVGLGAALVPQGE